MVHRRYKLTYDKKWGLGQARNAFEVPPLLRTLLYYYPSAPTLTAHISSSRVNQCQTRGTRLW
jgi:hypothetical protein